MRFPLLGMVLEKVVAEAAEDHNKQDCDYSVLDDVFASLIARAVLVEIARHNDYFAG
jgi:hypothetical protein